MEQFRDGVLMLVVFLVVAGGTFLIIDGGSGTGLPEPGDVPLRTGGEAMTVPTQGLEYPSSGRVSRLSGGIVRTEDRSHRIYGPFELRDEPYHVIAVGNGSYAVFNRSGDRFQQVMDDRVAAAVFATWQLYREAAMDPLLYGPGLGEGSGSLEQYEQQLVLAEGVYQEGERVTMPETREAVYDEVLQGRNLVPSRFIGAVRRTSMVTDRFLGQPSYERARLLMGSYGAAHTSYMEDLDDLVGILETTIARTSGSPVMEMPSGAVTDISVVLEDLGRIADNGAALRGEIDGRQALLDAEAMAVVDGPERVSDQDMPGLGTDRSLSGQELREAYDARNNISYPMERTEVSGPYRMDVPCMREQHLVSRVFSPEKTLYPELVVADASVRIVDHRGQPFSAGRPDSLFTACTCPYLEAGRASWHTIDRMVAVIEESLITEEMVEGADAAVADQLRRVARYEEAFLERPSDRGVEELGRAYTGLYRSLIEHRRAGGAVPEEISMERLWRASAVSRSGLSAIERTLENIRTSVGSRGENVFDPDRSGDRPVDIFGPTEVWRHSFYSFGFMTWSDAVWRLDTGLQKYREDTVDPLVQTGPLTDDR